MEEPHREQATIIFYDAFFVDVAPVVTRAGFETGIVHLEQPLRPAEIAKAIHPWAFDFDEPLHTLLFPLCRDCIAYSFFTALLKHHSFE